MLLEDLSAGVILLGIIAYAVFGGADFGGGVWTALASGPRAARQREAVFRAMGPVWETNHIWLIFVIVTLFTAFPSAFAQLFTALFIPLVVVLVGIIFRGVAFAFRHFGDGNETRVPLVGAFFSIASIITPLAMGIALGAVASGDISAQGGAATLRSNPWLRPFPLATGLIGVAVCAFLTAYFMTVRTDGQLREDFRRRGILASVALGALTTVALLVASWDARPFWERLFAPFPLVVIGTAVILGLASLVVLWRRLYTLAPPVAAGTVALVLAGWGAVQYPYLIPPDQRISDLAAGPTTLVPFLVSLVIGAVVLVPSLVFLYRTFSEKTG